MLVGKLLLVVGTCFVDTQGAGHGKITKVSKEVVIFDMYSNRGNLLKEDLELPVDLIKDPKIQERILLIKCPKGDK